MVVLQTETNSEKRENDFEFMWEVYSKTMEAQVKAQAHNCEALAVFMEPEQNTTIGS